MPEPLEDACASGDELRALRALRDRLAASLADCESSRDEAALSLRLMDCLARITHLEAVTGPAVKTPLSEFEERLRERQRNGGDTADQAGAGS